MSKVNNMPEVDNSETIHELVESYSQLARNKEWMVCSKVHKDNAFVAAWVPTDGVNWCRLIRYRNGTKVFHDTKLGDPVAITAAETKSIDDLQTFTS